MIALGWCLANQTLPTPLLLAGPGKVAVVCADASATRTARDRLGLLQRVFDAGIDVIPLSAGRAWPLPPALDNAANAATDLLGQITCIAGRGQLTIMTQWPADPTVNERGSTGRDWLQRLRDRQASEVARGQTARDVLLALGASIHAPKTAILPATTGFGLHLLLPRRAMPSACRQIAQAARTLTLLDGGTVTVTGLWPAFDFVHSPRCLEQVAP